MEERYNNSAMQSEDEEKDGILTRIMGSLRKNLFRIIFWAIIIIIVIFLTLFLSSKIGEFESISDMMRFIRSQFR